MKFKWCIFLLITVTFSSLIAQNSGARFLFNQPSAEAMALGGVGASTPDNKFAAYYNQAAFAFAEQAYVSASFMQPYSPFYNQTNSMVTFALPIKTVGTFALSCNIFWTELQPVTPESDPEYIGAAGIEPKLFNPAHINLQLSFARKIQENLSAGIGISMLNSRLLKEGSGDYYGYSNSTVALFNAGVLMTDLLPEITDTFPYPVIIPWAENTPAKGISCGLSIQNLGSNIKFSENSEGDPPPAFLLAGFNYWPLISNIVSTKIQFEVEKRIYDFDKIEFLHLGHEVRLFNAFALRYGYVANRINSGQSYFTYGFGFCTKFGRMEFARYKKYPQATWHFDLSINPGEIF